MKLIIACFVSLPLLMSCASTSDKNSTRAGSLEIVVSQDATPAELIFDVIFVPATKGAVQLIDSVLHSVPSSEDYLSFWENFDLPKSLLTVKDSALKHIGESFTPEELDYVAVYLRDPIIQKHYTNAITALVENSEAPVLSDREIQAISGLPIKFNSNIEYSIKYKIDEASRQIHLLLAEQLLEELHSLGATSQPREMIEQSCLKSYEADVFKDSYFVCGSGYKKGYPDSTKTFAKMHWRGEFVNKDVMKAIQILRDLLTEQYNTEAAFYYGALSLKEVHRYDDKLKAICWIRSASYRGHQSAKSLFNSVKDDYIGIPNQCFFISFFDL